MNHKQRNRMDQNSKIRSNKYQEKSWSKQHNKLFSLANFIHKYSIFRITGKTPKCILTFYGHLFGKLMIRNRKYLTKLRKSILTLFPTLSPKLTNKIINGHKAYMGALMLDAMLYSPNINYKTADQFIKFKNIDLLDKELAKRKGVIVVSAHIGWFFHVIAGLAYHPNRYNVLTLVQPANMKLYEYIVSRPEIRNILKLIPMDKFKDFKSRIFSHLSEKNGIFLILHDYSKFSHTKIEFWDNQMKLKIATPNSAAYLALQTSARIIITIPHPNRTIGNTLYEFIECEEINKLIENSAKEMDEQHFYEINKSINAKLAQYIIQYLHLWEELPNLIYRIADE